ncbi:MAG: 2-hydroxycarboxylate transporter family protein [Treponemataceae bacterium]
MILKKTTIFGMHPAFFLCMFTAVLLTHFADRIPSNTWGALAMCFSIGILFGEIGDRLPIWKDWIGGGAIMVFFASSTLAYFNLFSEREIEMFNNFMETTDFLDFYIGCLIVGSIMSLERTVLLKAFLGYIPAILGGLAGACLLGIAVGSLFGFSPVEMIIQYALPIMGGGNGGGAVPLSQIYESVTGLPKNIYYSKAISILTIGNIFAILGSAALNKIGYLFPKLSGNGLLMHGQKNVNLEESEVPFSPQDLAIGLFLIAVLYTFASFLAKYIGKIGDVIIHRLAYMILLTIILNALGVIPASIRKAVQKTQSFLSKQLLWVLMVGVGIVYTDLPAFISTLNITNLVICLFIVVGGIIGSGFVGTLFKFYFIETALTAGCCMANRGGSGDLECLTAAKRMELMPYAQISSRIGGGIVLVIASIVFGIFL